MNRWSGVVIVGLLLCGFLTGVVFAQKTFIYGAGNNSCGSWVVERQQKSDLSYIHSSWVLGFFTGANHFLPLSKIYLKETDSAAMLVWMDKYCAEHPLEPIHQAAMTLVFTLREK
jgi:hypothetical protein